MSEIIAWVLVAALALLWVLSERDRNWLRQRWSDALEADHEVELIERGIIQGDVDEARARADALWDFDEEAE